MLRARHPNYQRTILSKVMNKDLEPQTVYVVDSSPELDALFIALRQGSDLYNKPDTPLVLTLLKPISVPMYNPATVLNNEPWWVTKCKSFQKKFRKKKH